MAEPAPRPHDAQAPVQRAPESELLVAVCGLVLLIALLGLRWFGADGVPRPALAQPPEYSLGTFAPLGAIAWLALATALGALASVWLHASGRIRVSRRVTGLVLALLGGSTSVLLIWRVLIALPDERRVVDAKLGAIVGLLCAVGIWMGAIGSLRPRRAPRRGPGTRPARAGGGRT
jgi:hypothetical protein